jgi:hypothetical protein
MTGAWTTLRASELPPRLGTRMSQALHALATAVGARNRRTAPQAALDVADAGLDLQLRYRHPAEVNRARFQLWTRRLLADAAARDAAAVHGDVTTLAWIRDRIPLASTDGNDLDDRLRHLRWVADAHEFKAAMAQAARLHEALTGLKPTP